MRGHEYIREAVRTFLEDKVPARLTAHLAAYGLASPDPADLKFYLADGLQDISNFPAVVVRSTDSSDDVRTADGTWMMTYDLEVIVACEHRVHNDPESASKNRDRVLLAVREAIYSVTGLTDDIDLAPRKRPEQTGAAMETLVGVPLAAGTIKFVARVQETLSDLDPAEDIDDVDLIASAYDASQTIP